MLEPLTVLRTSRKALPGVNFCVRGAPTTAREDRRSWDRVEKKKQVSPIYPGEGLLPEVISASAVSQPSLGKIGGIGTGWKKKPSVLHLSR